MSPRHLAAHPAAGVTTPGSTESGVPLVVAFTSPDEFIRELNDRGPNVKPLLRLTFRWTLDASGAPIHHLSILAGYLRQVGDGPVTMVTLRHYVGSVWQGVPDGASQQARERAARLRDLLEQAARAMGLEIGAGTYELHSSRR